MLIWSMGPLLMLSEQRKLATYMFTDMVGYSALAQKNEFASAVDATRCAVEIQQTLASRNAVTPAEERIQIRIGLHLSDVVVRDGRVHGDGVNIGRGSPWSRKAALRNARRLTRAAAYGLRCELTLSAKSRHPT